MRETMQQISDHLAEEIECYRELLRVVESEQQILLHGRHEELLGTADEKLKLSQRLAHIQTERRELMTKPSGDGVRPAKLIDMTRYLPSEERPEFREAVKKAAQLSRRLASQNQLNKGYLEEALDTVEHLIGILTGRGRGNAYGRRGRMEAARVPRMLAREV